MRTSYKPKENELILHDSIMELKQNLFKGVPSKIVRISGDLLKHVDAFLLSQDTKNYTNAQREKHAEAILKTFFAVTEHQVDSRKKRFYKTGIRFGGSQLLVTEFVFPVPHVKQLAIVLVTLDLYDAKAKEFWMRSSFWSLNFDDDMPQELQNYYSDSVNLEPLDRTESLHEMFLRLLFDISPPKKLAA